VRIARQRGGNDDLAERGPRTGEAGVDPEWARTLPERLDALGLRDVDAEVDTQLFRGRSDAAELWSLTWFQVRDRTDAEAIDAGRAALARSAGSTVRRR
jgi:hypothetical protein